MRASSRSSLRWTQGGPTAEGMRGSPRFPRLRSSPSDPQARGARSPWRSFSPGCSPSMLFAHIHPLNHGDIDPASSVVLRSASDACRARSRLDVDAVARPEMIRNRDRLTAYPRALSFQLESLTRGQPPVHRRVRSVVGRPGHGYRGRVSASRSAIQCWRPKRRAWCRCSARSGRSTTAGLAATWSTRKDNRGRWGLAGRPRSVPGLLQPPPLPPRLQDARPNTRRDLLPSRRE